jgi:predicted metal-dependent hydrolase
MNMVLLKQKLPHYITVGETRLPLIVKKHPRARNLVVRYDMQGECVRITVPRHVSLQRAVEFAISKTVWIEKQLAKKEKTPFADGATIPLWGGQVRLKYVGGRGITGLVGDELQVTGAVESLARRVRDYIIKEMRIRTQEIAAPYALALGVSIRSIRIGDMRSRWGSCTSGGALSFSLRLAFVPPEVLDYVVCHEVCHIKHLNHSDAYWQTVEGLCAGYRQHERWLSQHGSSVWSYG